MGAKKDYSVVIDGFVVYVGPIRTATIVYKSFESFFSCKGDIKDHNLVLSFKI
ncbi:hypothetical protein [Dipodfec virus UOA04_Rod_847]|nr:hypothetical protein [Dipodfec virus UOA04_Rod_847]